MTDKKISLSLKDGLLSSRRHSSGSSVGGIRRGSASTAREASSGISILSAVNLLKWKNNSVKPKMLGFKELKRKKEKPEHHDPMNTNVFQLREYFSRRWFSISVVKNSQESESVQQRIEKLRKIFKQGSFLLSNERNSEISTLHVDIKDEEIMERNESDPEVITTIFKEVFSLKSNLNGNVMNEKCFIVLGFNIAESDSYNFFMNNWRELSGLGNLLTCLTPKFFVGRVSFLVSSEFGKQKDHFHFMVLVEIFFNAIDLIYLLDFVQQFRVRRNFGFISIYSEFSAPKQTTTVAETGQ